MNKRGQILYPMAFVLLALLGFGVLLVNLSRLVYWRLRMDTAADAATLSAARILAEGLNRMGTLNNSLNLFFVPLTKIENVAAMEVSFRGGYEAARAAARGAERGYRALPYSAGYEVARLNGATGSVPLRKMSLRLAGKKLHVGFYKMIGPIPVPCPPFGKTYEPGYWTRRWGPDHRRAQPDHRVAWRVWRDDLKPVAAGWLGLRPAKVSASAGARVWLDVAMWAHLQNGGFPREKENILGNIGFQSFYPQFNARLVTLREALR